MNERITESYVREQLRNAGYYDNEDLIIEEQISENPKIKKLLSTASKRGTGAGYPEFIIRSRKTSDLLIVIECKADIKFHESDTLDNYADYAVDGALLYSSYLSKNYDVIGLAVSGVEPSNMKISHFLTLEEESDPHPFLGNEILPFSDYVRSVKESDYKFRQDYNNLLGYAKILNELLHVNKIKEAQRSLLISGILIALQNTAFRESYRLHPSAVDLANSLFNTIVAEFNSAGLRQENRESLKQAFSFLTTHTTLNSDKEFFVELISAIDENINNFLRTYEYFDTIGQFYIEFLRYANNDKGLGIVLTPPHITDLFVDLAEVNSNSIVYDNCCGTGGFLISAMKKMVKDAKGNTSKIREIKENQIIGIEYQDDIYTLCISNMIVHGDGKTNIIPGDCFDHTESIRDSKKPDVGLLNPPYKSSPSDREELDFVLDNLSALKVGGKCIAIVPLSCALATTGITFERKQALLEQHTLEAVMSMPLELFHNSNAGVVTCAMVFTAHRPHPEGKKTWLGYWRDDGFEKVKNRGRIDRKNLWPDISHEWITHFYNRETIQEKCLMQHLSADDEWCIEEFMETDYSKLSVGDFKIYTLDYLSHSIFREDINFIKSFEEDLVDLVLEVDKWGTYTLDDLFDVSLGTPLHKNSLLKTFDRYHPDLLAYISRTTQNNGVSCYVKPDHVDDGVVQLGNAITIGAEGFEAFYQEDKFVTGNKVNILRNPNLNPFSALFICPILNLEFNKKFNYGRGLVKSRLEKLSIKLPKGENGPDYKFMENFIKSLKFGNFDPS